MHASPYKEPAREIGTFERRYSSPSPVRNVILIFSIFGLPGVALLTGFQSAKGEVFAGDRTTNGIIGAALLGFAIYIVAMLHRKAKLRVDVYTNGLGWHEHGRVQKIFYRDIAEIKGAHTSRRVAGNEVARTHVYTMQLEDGRSYLFSNMLAGAGDLAARIERELAAHLLPRVRQAFQAGETFSFGPLKLAIDRVTHGEVVIFWDDVKSVAIENGVVTIDAKNKRKIEIAWSAIPNANVLVVIAKERAKLTPDAGSP